MYGQTQIFPLFSPYFGSLAVKAMAFIEISSFSLLNIAVGPTHTQILRLMYGQAHSCCYFTIGLAHWL